MGKMSDSRQDGDSGAGAGTGIGQILVIVGLVCVYGVGAYWVSVEVILADDQPWWLKIGLPAVVVGTTILFVTVLLQRMKAAQTDKYTDVKD
ncbi:MAG TPA: hypothetical protein DCE47_04030 [Planctomycetaceae bacterium]|nr:hypothetical protein [Planctomycetaceae bacterium]